MKQIVLDMQSTLYARALSRILVQELDGYQVIISESPDITKKRCELIHPYALLMEVNAYSPWRLSDRLATRRLIKDNSPDCKIVLLVNDNADRSIADDVKRAKRDGLIDAFLYSSVSDSYLAAMMDSL